MHKILISITFLMSAAYPATAADTGYDMVPATGEQLKIDHANGRVSICSSKEGDWRCRLIPDDRDAYEADLSRLESENAALKAELAALKENGPSERFGDSDIQKMERFMTFSDKAFRGFFDVVDGLKRDGKIPVCP